jgi:cyclic pyranopterin phosphate synthase
MPTLETLVDSNAEPAWARCRFLTCSVLPVRLACNLTCPFCFSRSSISTLRQDRLDWQRADVEAYYAFACERGATRLVITGGGEPLLRAEDVVRLIARGRHHFTEIACFTNGTFLTPELARRLAEAGLSYLCYSRHHEDDARCRALMGPTAPALESFFRAAEGLKVRATCVMTRGHVDSPVAVDRYIHTLARFGVREFTFKHTYVAYEDSVFGGSRQNAWAAENRVHDDPFAGRGAVVARLPWGPTIRRLGDFQVCYYHEPHPGWEKEHQLCRSINVLSDGNVYASLEDHTSRLFRLIALPAQSGPKTWKGSGRSCRSVTRPAPPPTARPWPN